MSTTFSSVEEAKAVVASIPGANLATFEEASDLHVGGMNTILLDDPNTSEKVKQEIQERIDAQKGFKFKNKDGERFK